MAFRIARGNSDIAYEFLINGIPEEMLEGALEEGEEGEEGAYGNEYAEGEMEDNPFAALASNPNFENIRQRITSDPAFYQQFMDQLQEQ